MTRAKRRASGAPVRMIQVLTGDVSDSVWWG
jgi:hypothetical protein